MRPRWRAAWDRLETWSQLVAAALLGVRQRELGGVMRILAGWFGCGGPSRSVPCCWARSPWPLPAFAADDHVVRLELQGVIDQVNAAYIEQGLATAAEGGAAAALIEIDSPGGELTSMDRIIKAILGSEVPVITYVTPEGAQAGSAATFITLAGDVAAMAPSTTIGAASVVGSGGADLPDTLADKINNSNAAKIKDLAAAHNRNTEWAEAAVRDAASVSAAEAVAMDPPVVDLVATDVDDLFAQIDSGQRADGQPYEFEGEPLPPLSGLPIQDVNMSLGQSFLHLLSDPNIAFILFTIGFYGIVSELFHPNFFSGPVGVIALVLAFIGSNSLPLNVAGLLLILIGIGLFILELHVTSLRPPDHRWGDRASCWAASRCGPGLTRSRTRSTSRSARGCWPWSWRCRWPTCTASCAR